MDFTAYYTAGKAVVAGLSPYKNYILEDWNLWDGFAQYQHSRFLYPPLLAKFFQPLSILPYFSAKSLWNVINVIILFVNLFLLIVTFRTKKIWQIFIILIAALNFFPLIALLERGQIDNFALLFILLTIYLVVNKKSFFTAGILLGIATLFKLYLLFIIPFLVLKKQKELLGGYFVSLASLSILTLIMVGPGITYDYFTSQAPRIASFGSSGTQEMLIPVWILIKYFPMTPISVSLIEGRMYLSESISFNSKASLVKVIDNITNSLGIVVNPVFTSVIVFTIFFFILYYITRTKNLIIKSDQNLSDFFYWQVSILIILLSSPYTWIMSLIWLFPSLFFILYLWDKRSNKYIPLPLVIISIGYVLLSIPDNFFFLRNVNIVNYVIQARFIIGELILFSGFIFLYRSDSSTAYG
ncbi:MAG: glycosyltransferase family 87 protein [Ignavibacteria bacterium]